MSQEKQITVEQVQAAFKAKNLPKPEAPTQVNPTYCLSVPSAMELMLILGDLQPVGYADPPLIYTGGPFTTSSEVPWFEFKSNGAIRNAGQLAQYWNNNNGNPGGNTAESRARQDIAWG